MEKILKDNVIVGYYGDKAIVETEYGDLYFFDCERDLIPVGSVTDAELETLDKLDAAMKQEILKRFQEE